MGSWRRRKGYVRHIMEYEKVEVNSERWFDLTPLLNEEFRDIIGYENLYQVSNYGRVKSLERYKQQIRKNKTINVFQKEKILLQVQKDSFYYTIALYNNKRRKDIKVHILVANAFLNKNDIKKIDESDKMIIEVNHKDENKSNNMFYNLEFCTKRYNCNYGTRIERIQKTKRGD